MIPHIARNSRIWLLVSSLVIFLLTFFSLNKDTGSDPKLTLLVAQSVLENGTIRLDAYQGDSILNLPFSSYLANGSILASPEGHFYNYFPLGPSIFALPAVAIARLWGLDMRLPGSEQVQYWLAALTSTAVFLLIYALARAYLDTLSSYLIAFVSVLGSSFVSTLGTAWWSHNPAVIFILLILLLLVGQAHDRSANPYLLGLLLFLTYFARAGTAPFILVVLVYLFFQARGLFWRAAGTAAFLLALLLLWTHGEYGQWLPAYFSVARLQVIRTPTWVGILGNLISPSRGLFIFSPYLLLAITGAIWFWRDLRRQPLVWLCLAWFILQLWLVARAASWWGGASFGPRLLTDALPALVLLTILVWQAAEKRLSRRGYRIMIAVYLGLGFLAALLHVGQGLYSRPAVLWNFYIQPRFSSTTGGLGDLFTWRYAQPLATNSMLCRIEQEKMAAYLPGDQTLAPYFFGDALTIRADRALEYDPFAPQMAETGAAVDNSTPPDTATWSYRYHLPLVAKQGNLALFWGWSDPEPAWRWSRCATASLLLRLGEEPKAEADYMLLLKAGAFGPQTVSVELNGKPIGAFILSGEAGLTENVALPVDAALLRPFAENTITIQFSNPHYPRPSWENGRLQFDQRLLALSFMELRLIEGEMTAESHEEPQFSAYP